MRDSSLKTKLAFYSWLALLLITLGTFAAGLFGHFVTLIAAPWLSLRNPSGHPRRDPRPADSSKVCHSATIAVADALRTSPSNFSILDRLEQSQVPPAGTYSPDPMVSCQGALSASKIHVSASRGGVKIGAPLQMMLSRRKGHKRPAKRPF